MLPIQGFCCRIAYEVKNMTTSTKVFISYSSKDRSFITTLARDLQSQGLDVWFDVWKITGREPYWQEIETGIETSSHLLFIVSPESIEPNCGARDELAHAKHYGKKIVVIMAKAVNYDDLPIEITPGRYQIHDIPKLGYAKGLEQVMEALSNDNDNTSISSRYVPKPGKKKYNWEMLSVFVAALTIVVMLIVPFIENSLKDGEDNSPTNKTFIDITVIPVPTSICTMGLDIRLEVNGLGRIDTPGDGLSLYSTVDVDTQPIITLPNDSIVNILEGPICSQGSNWWRISANAIEGWIPEGAGENYFVDPID
jgi:hypothetical protein